VFEFFLVQLIGPNGSMQVTFPDISWLNDLREAIKQQCNLLNENDPTANNSRYRLITLSLSTFYVFFILLDRCCTINERERWEMWERTEY
jgi:hypothetical protein